MSAQGREEGRGRNDMMKMVNCGAAVRRRTASTLGARTRGARGAIPSCGDGAHTDVEVVHRTTPRGECSCCCELGRCRCCSRAGSSCGGLARVKLLLCCSSSATRCGGAAADAAFGSSANVADTLAAHRQGSRRLASHKIDGRQAGGERS